MDDEKVDGTIRPKEERRARLGPILCWAVVFADIGSSVYYVPGILYGNVGSLAGFFVLATMSVFVLLALKYAEVTNRFPHGGGVVAVASQAMNHWVGALGGMFILVIIFSRPLSAAFLEYSISVSSFQGLNPLPSWPPSELLSYWVSSTVLASAQARR